MRTKITNHRAAVAARLAADNEWSKVGEPDNGPEWEAHNMAIAREFETFGELFESSPTTAIEAAALFERLAEPLYDDDEFTAIEQAVELWKGGGRRRHFPSAKVWVAQMAAAFERIAAP
jgi:hypothetical protein